LEAEACCRLTRSLTTTAHTLSPTAAPTPLGTANLRDESGLGDVDVGTEASCRIFGGPADTDVTVWYGEDLECPMCAGATVEGDGCDARGTGAGSTTSDAAAMSSRWRMGIAAVVGGAFFAMLLE